VQKEPRAAYQLVEVLNEDVSLEMVVIPGGTFLMGSPEDEIDRWSDESPQHEVSVEAFCMGKYPITQAQWRFVAGLELINRTLEADPSNFKGDDRPVETVSWEDAVEYCDRLSRHTQKQYQLPTEAQWEYACRAGTTTPFHFGETITTDVANYCGTDYTDSKERKWSGSYGDGPKGVYREETTPVDHFEIANAFGLVDMHGNVWEWCADHWHDNYEGAPKDGTAWLIDPEELAREELNLDSEKEGKKEVYRVIRGGSWLNYPGFCRAASRFSFPPVNRLSYVGFRVCCAAPRALP
jgi:formylglycine-generating enzyme required for sulfatase activity